MNLIRFAWYHVVRIWVIMPLFFIALTWGVFDDFQQGTRGWLLSVWIGYIALNVYFWVRVSAFRRDLGLVSHLHPNGHESDLFDNAKYTCIHNVRPDSKTGRCAWSRYHPISPEPSEAERKIKIWDRNRSAHWAGPIKA